MIEATAMTKSYKMPILLAFYNEGKMKFSLSEDDVYESFIGKGWKMKNEAL